MIRGFLLAVLLALAGSAGAADVYSYSSPQGDRFRLFDEPCPVATGWLVLKRAEVLWKGKTYAACWALFHDIVIIFDEEGDTTPTQMQIFKKEVIE